MGELTNRRRVLEGIRSEIEAARGTRIWTDYVNALKLISQVVFTRSSGFILELLQNAEDAGLELGTNGVFQIHLDKSRIKISHNGRAFNEDDVRALCGIQSSKKPEKGTLGYLGIGFKSVFKATDSPEIYSNGFQFKFDRHDRAWRDPAATPWHILPLWIQRPSEPVDRHLTTFVIPFRDESQYSWLRDELKNLTTDLYLFLHWVRRITITDEVTGQTSVIENLGESDGITTLRHNEREDKFRFFRKVIEGVPEWVRGDRLTQEYRANVDQREIAIAVALDADGNLAPTEAGAMYGGVYSFLPLGEARSGVKFPIQADFLVQPGRDAINCEAPWNQWLVDEVLELCKAAIAYFMGHERWKYQFLAAFEFSKSPGLESYDRLFGPRLIEPLESFLDSTACIPTADGGLAGRAEVVRLDEDQKAGEDLVRLGVLERGRVAEVLGGQPGLQLVHPDVLEGTSNRIRKVSRWDLLQDDAFLRSRAQTPDAPAWFRALYLWLGTHPFYESYFHYKLRKRVRTYHEHEFILTAAGELLKGGEVSVLYVSAAQHPLIVDLARELKTSRPMLHPAILREAADSQEREALRGFLAGLTGLQVLDAKAVCREALLPRILVGSPAPPPTELWRYSAICRQVLGAELGPSAEIWILTKGGDTRPAREVLLSQEFRPVQNWEIHERFVAGLSFVDTRYLDEGADDVKLQEWRAFFRAGGVRDAPENGVEEFAVNYATEQLRACWRTVTPVESRNLGYDLEAEDRSGRRVQAEVKGYSAEKDLELSPNETLAADRYRASYYLCVVAGIPEHPTMYMVQDPAAAGKKEKVTIPVAVWKVRPWK